MAASTTNIQMGSAVAGISEIALSSHSISEAWLGGNQVWAKSTGGGGDPVTETWLTHPSNFLMVAYTPATAVTVVSISMKFNSLQAYNYCWGIWTKSGSNAVPLAGFVASPSTAGCSWTNDGVLGTETKYKHTKTWEAGSRPSLSAGTTYLIGVGERYASSRKIIGVGGSQETWQAYEWSISATGNPSIVTTTSTVIPLLTVVTE